jgi:lysozyme family protein
MSQLTTSFFSKILEMEGGYQAMTADVGNYACGNLVGTNMGVSAVAWEMWKGRCPTVADMRNLTTADALQFYRWYWNLYNIDGVNNQALAELIMNNTMGAPKRAAEAEQRALQRLGYSNVEEDGDRGPITLAALNDAANKNLPRVYNLVREEWVNYLNTINSQFRQGWINRMNRHFPPMEASSSYPGTVTAGGGWLGLLLLIGIFVATKK